ncbi:MAG: prolipoprotein diacylglyceryl transferase [Ahrensia sp.]|nr:prolipoprotein diacylglyceryl transferase [Ahrensia sp.]
MFQLALPQLAIAFPNLDPVLFQIGPLAIRWYSLAYIVGIVFGWWYAKQIIRNKRLWGGNAPMSEVDLDDFLLWATVGIVLGGRLGYVLFYNFDAFMANPADIFRVWEGGMSFHGGMLGIIIAMVAFARSRKIHVWSLIDVIAVVAPVGFGLGRIANFINSELWGRTTDVPWGVIFPNGGPMARHPSQLYEAALEGLLLAIVLYLVVYKFEKLKFPRFATGVGAIVYGASRILVEFFREPDAQLGYLFGDWLTMGMVLSMPMVIIGLSLVLSAKRTEFVARENDDVNHERT